MGFPDALVSKESTFNAGDVVQFLGQEHPLEKGMEPHSSILVWEIPCTEEPAGLQSMVASTLSIFCTILLFYVILKLQS